MMKASTSFGILCVVAALAIGSAHADASDFPSFDIFHSHCSVQVSIPGKLCYNVFGDLVNTIIKFNDGSDPAHGSYQFKERQAISHVWLVHNSKKGWDSDVIFEPAQVGDDCLIRGRSRTQSTFHSAGTENYCDLWNVYQSVGPYTGMAVSSCSSTPSDPKTKCTQ